MVIFRQILGQIGKIPTHNIDDFAVLEESSNDEEALVDGVFDLSSCDMGASHVADIDPEGRAGREEFGFFEFAIGYIADALVWCIEVFVEINQMRINGPKHEGGIDL